MVSIEKEKFNYINQICECCCIFASIENVIKYYDKDSKLSQKIIMSNLEKKFGKIRWGKLCFSYVMDVVNNKPSFNNKFKYKEFNKGDFKNNFNAYWNFIKDTLTKENPLIVNIKIDNSHSMVVIEIDDDFIQVFEPNTLNYKLWEDSGFKIKDGVLPISKKDWFKYINDGSWGVLYISKIK